MVPMGIIETPTERPNLVAGVVNRTMVTSRILKFEGRSVLHSIIYAKSVTERATMRKAADKKHITTSQTLQL